MRRYHVSTSEKMELAGLRVRLEHARTSGDAVPVTGTHESVPISFALLIGSIAARPEVNLKAGVDSPNRITRILEFQGRTFPESDIYHAEYREDSPLITLFVEDDVDALRVTPAYPKNVVIDDWKISDWQD